jgi:hypothetical protein
MNELKRTGLEKTIAWAGYFHGLRLHHGLSLLGMVATMKHLEMASVLGVQ